MPEEEISTVRAKLAANALQLANDNDEFLKSFETPTPQAQPQTKAKPHP